MELDRELGTDLNGPVSAALDVLERRPFLAQDSGESDAEGIDTSALVDDVGFDVTEREGVLVVDAGTASAAESFAPALRTLGRAILVGHRTAGAANPGDYFAASSGLSVFVSTGAPRDPRSGQGWKGTGLEPDLACHALTHLHGHR